MTRGHPDGRVFKPVRRSAAVLAGPGQQREEEGGSEGDGDTGDLLHTASVNAVPQPAIKAASSEDEGFSIWPSRSAAAARYANG
jgi:hypothetical protein